LHDRLAGERQELFSSARANVDPSRNNDHQSSLLAVAKGRVTIHRKLKLATGLYQMPFLVNYRQGRPAAEIKDLIDDTRWRISP
jgi:hypothetical protein